METRAGHVDATDPGGLDGPPRRALPGGCDVRGVGDVVCSPGSAGANRASAGAALLAGHLVRVCDELRLRRPARNQRAGMAGDAFGFGHDGSASDRRDGRNLVRQRPLPRGVRRARGGSRSALRRRRTTPPLQTTRARRRLVPAPKRPLHQRQVGDRRCDRLGILGALRACWRPKRARSRASPDQALRCSISGGARKKRFLSGSFPAARRSRAGLVGYGSTGRERDGRRYRHAAVHGDDRQGYHPDHDVSMELATLTRGSVLRLLAQR
jgi:hypothetical protein